MSHLLDANALIAPGWPTHEHHPRMIRNCRRMKLKLMAL